LVVRNAFCDALRGASFSNQKPMSRYEHRPIISHAMNVRRRLLDRTSTSIAEVNNDSTPKYQPSRRSPRM